MLGWELPGTGVAEGGEGRGGQGRGSGTVDLPAVWHGYQVVYVDIVV